MSGLIAIDWGTSNLRASLLDAQGKAVETRSAPGGVMKVKDGTSNLQAVYEYAEPVTAKGFVYMDTPGYDPVSATGQVAGGANLICFTTGRGSAYGCAPSPSLKFSTNTALWKKQEEDMDLNCGEIVDGGVSIAEMGQRIFDMILAAASGEPTKSERHGYGQNEFVPWQVGAVM
jgi:altronate hydrolase